MNSITLDGVTFRWDWQELLVTTATSQKRLPGTNALQLSDFLLSIQQDLYAVEQARDLPVWVRPPLRSAHGQVSDEQLLRLTSGTIIIGNQDELSRAAERIITIPCNDTLCCPGSSDDCTG